jgi:hypothetical protein
MGSGLYRRPAMKRIKIDVVERAGWWQVKVCGLRHSRYRSRAAARHGAKLLAARVQKLRVLARSRLGRMQLGQRLRVAHCELYCIRMLLRGRR